MTAREMFEAMDYTQSIDEYTISYEKTIYDEHDGEATHYCITFWLGDKSFYAEKDYKAMLICGSLFQAILQQMKELECTETTADDMFKNAGYRIEKDTGMIWYRNDHKEIDFYLGNKIVTVIDRSRHYDVDDAAWFTYKETQAIIKKMQELEFDKREDEQ